MKRSFVPGSHIKVRHSAVVLALQQDARRYGGGLPELADQLGRNYGTLKNALCPTNYNSEPTAELLLDVIETTGGAQTIAAIARLGGMRAVAVPDNDVLPASKPELLRHLTATSGRCLAEFAEALGDGVVDADERARLVALLEQLAGQADRILARLRRQMPERSTPAGEQA